MAIRSGRGVYAPPKADRSPPIIGKIARCLCCMRITNEWAIPNVQICNWCNRHGAAVLTIGGADFGDNPVLVQMCNGAPEMRNQQVFIQDLISVAQRIDMQELESPGGGGMADPGYKKNLEGHFSGFVNKDGERRSLAAQVPRRDNRGRRYFDTPEGRKYVEAS